MNCKIPMSKICVIIGLLWLYRPSLLNYYSPLFQWLFFSLAAFQILCSIIYAKKNDYKIDGVEKWIIVFYSLLLLLNTVNNTSMVHCIKEIVGVLTLMCSLKVGSSSTKYCYFDYAFRIGVFFTTINTLSALMFPQSLAVDHMGAASVFVLGGDNSSIVLYLLSVLFEIMYYRTRKGIKFPLYTIANLWVFSIIRDIATGMVVSAMITILLFLIIIIKRGRWVTPTLAIILNIAFTGTFVFMQATFDFMGALLGLLGRNATLTQRTALWSMSVDWIKERPLFGYGFLEDDAFNELVRTRTNSGLFNTGNPHNTYLTILLSGGVVLLCIFVVLLVKIIKRCKVMKGLYLSLFGSFLLVVMIHAQVEGRDITMLFYFCMIFYYYRKDFPQELHSCKLYKPMKAEELMNVGGKTYA